MDNSLIKRQDAIDAAQEWFDGLIVGSFDGLKKKLEALPSVQPEQHWETCFDCPLSHGCPIIRGCTNEQAMEYASKIPNDCPLSAQPERKKGK